MSSVSSSSSSSDDGNQIPDMDVFILAGRMAKLLADDCKSSGNRKKVLAQLANFYNMKLVPLNTVSQGSNQILNHLSKDSKTQGGSKDYSATTKKGQPPPNPIKRDPEYIKMSQDHLKAVEILKKFDRTSNEHHEQLKIVRQLEIAMADFKRARGRSVVAPAIAQNIVQSDNINGENKSSSPAVSK